MGLKYRSSSIKTVCYYLLVIAVSFGLVSCEKINLRSPFAEFSVSEIRNVAFDNGNNNLSEVAPPEVIQKLAQTLVKYQPQVTIVSPRSDSTLSETTVEVRVAVEDYPLFRDDRLKMGPHLNLILDDESYTEIYNVEEAIALKDLKPGTHTLRLLAETPWHESFKNPEAYAQTTFNVLTETAENKIDPDLPLLTYNQPEGNYGAEPILLDFYLTNVKADDWQVKATINNESFIIDEWQPVYLEGLLEGNNLIQLELLDSNGETIKNSFDRPIRLITYQETNSQQNSLAQLVTDKISFEEAVAIVEQNYYIQPVGEPEIIDTITEELAIEAPVESETEVIEEPSVEEIPIEIESEIVSEEKVDRERSPVIIQEPTIETNDEILKEETEETAVVDKIKEAIEKVNETSTEQIRVEIITPEITIETIPQTSIEPQNLETKQILAKDFSEENNVSTNSVIEKTTSLKTNDSDILKEVTEIPIPEKVRAVETAEDIIALNTDRSDTITIEIPKPKKLKVPQWWKNLIASIQQLFKTD